MITVAEVLKSLISTFCFIDMLYFFQKFQEHQKMYIDRTRLIINHEIVLLALRFLLGSINSISFWNW